MSQHDVVVIGAGPAGEVCAGQLPTEGLDVALVDREGRIGQTGTVFFNTLLAENAASHLALGNAYALSVGEAERDRINSSSIHIDFMIGSNEVAVTGAKADGTRVRVLRDGSWQL